MSNIKIRKDNGSSSTSVPNSFIDNYMIGANGEYVKIYLYLLRCMNTSNELSISSIADKLEHTEKDISRALKYWEKSHLLTLEYDDQQQLSGICLVDDAPDIPEPEVTKTSNSIIERSTEMVKQSYTKDQLQGFRSTEDVEDLFFSTETYLGRTLNANDIHTIFYWYKDLHLPITLIEYLIEYCVDLGHKSLHYMDKVAIQWAKDGILTVSMAKTYTSTRSDLSYAILKTFGITGRTLGKGELDYINTWTNTYHFSSDIILEACNRTLLAIHQPSFDYAHKILDTWHKQEVKTMEDIKNIDQAYQLAKKSHSKPAKQTTKSTTGNKFNNFDQRNYNYSKLEEQLLNS